MKINFINKIDAKTKTLVFPLSLKQKMQDELKNFDEQNDKIISKAMALYKFTGKNGQIVQTFLPKKDILIVLAGVGVEKNADAACYQNLGSSVFDFMQKIENKEVSIFSLSKDAALNIAFGISLREYNFDKYISKENEQEDENSLQIKEKAFYICTEDPKSAEDEFIILDAKAQGMNIAKAFINEPGNVINPKTFAEEIKKLEKLGLKVEIIDAKKLQKLGANLILNVGKASETPPCMAIIKWQGDKSIKDYKIALAGKGITYDAGGLCLKPREGQLHMFYDMAGAGAVCGTMAALALAKDKHNVAAIVGLAENAISSNAMRVGDIIKSLSGKTVEIINTDAEGRLVLADIITYIQNEYKPEILIDVATLTGAMTYVLGAEYAGLFSNDENLAEKLYNTGFACGDKVWNLPLCDEYDKMIKSDVADVKNLGGAEAASATAAQFIKRFVKDNVKWAHIDIAGVAWSKSENLKSRKGATGFGLKLLFDFITTK